METKKLKAIGLMTTGRCGLTQPLTMIFSAFNAAGIPLKNSGGVFYGQNMQLMLEKALSDEIDIVVTVDWDSIFSVKQLNAIIENAVSDNSIDALAALQSRRGMANPLFSIDTSKATGDVIEVKFEGKPLQVKTAHFGLTVIKVAKLKDVPKPWFFSQPGESGSWDDKRIDDDIWFWKQWEKAGNSVYIDSSISIGHMEEFVTCYDETGSHQVMYPSDYRSLMT